MSKTTIRTNINKLDRDPNLVLLEQEGIVSAFGNLTSLGRRVQADLVFRGEAGDMQTIVDAVNRVYAEDGTEVTES